MNSLIAKTMYNHLTKRNKPFKIFLDSSKSKDYMHVDDFCESIVIAATSQYILNFNTDFNISAGEPVETNKIVDEIENLGIDTSYIQWRPDTDYLGNHIVSNSKFKIATYNKWEPKVSLVEGLKRVRSEILSLPLNTEYNPFKHLDEIEEKDIDIETHYNFKG